MTALPPQPPRTPTNVHDAGEDPRLDLYLDGLLEGDDLAAFERDLAASPALRRQLEAQQRIDAELRRLFAYDPARAASPQPEPTAIAGRIDGTTVSTKRPAAPSPTIRRLRLYAIAAVLLLALAGSWAAYVHLTTPTFDKVLSPAEVYAMVDQPEFVCETDAEFAAAIDDRLGQPLVLAAAPGIEAIGWAYGDDYNGRIVGRKTMVLINKVRGQKVLVFMDRRRDDRALDTPPSSGLNLFRREVGDLVLYEVTPLDQPEVIPRLNIP